MRKNLKDRAAALLRKAGAAGTKYLGSLSKFESLVGKLNKKSRTVSQVNQYFKEVPIFVEMIRAWIRGDYRDVPYKTILAMTGAIVYLVNPFDLLPSAIPVIGQIDDMAVLALAWNIVEKDVKAYQKWKKDQKKDLKEMDPKEAAEEIPEYEPMDMEAAEGQAEDPAGENEDQVS